MNNLKKAMLYYKNVQSMRGTFPNEVLNWQLLGKFSGGLTKILGRKITQRICDIRHDKTRKFLKSEFKDFLSGYNFDRSESANSKIIWSLWLQGYDSAPRIVQRTLDSIETFARSNGYQFILLEQDSIEKYITFPKHIKGKLSALSATAISDLVRVCLLSEYGGVWLDSTVYIRPEFSAKHFENCFFTLKTGSISDFSPNVSKNRWKTFLLSGNSRLYTFTRDFFFEYYKKYDVQVDYLLIDYIFDLAYHLDENIRIEMDTLPQVAPRLFWLENHINSQFKIYEWENIVKDTQIFKTTYKLPKKVFKISDNYYNSLLNGQL